MDTKEILTKAIKKAIDGGWMITSAYVTNVNDMPLVLGITWEGRYGQAFNYETILFSHKFAKALWGDDMLGEGYFNQTGSEILMPAYLYHLERMVVADDPIEYLGENI